MKESEAIVKGIGKSDGGIKNDLIDPMKMQNTSNINWERMLEEDLDEMMKENERF